MARPKFVAIVHEESGLVGKCLPESLSAWERNGWTAVDDGDDVTEQDELDDDEADPDEPGDNKE